MTTLTLTTATDHPLVASDATTTRIVEWTVSAAAVAQPTARAPLNLALILDRSGSMSGDKLRYVQQAAVHVLGQLDERDRVAVVAYDDQINLLAGSQRMTAAARQSLKAQIEALRPGGSTDLGGGWLRGCGEIATQITAETLNRALLLTDGLANHGITDPEELARHARELRRRGIATSTFGVGLDFNEDLLQALAETGGGHFFFIERPQHIPDVFRQELGELLAVVAKETVLNIAIPNGTTVQLLGDLAHEQNDGGLRVFLGDVGAGEQRMIYARIIAPPDAPQSTLVVSATLSYANLGGHSEQVTAEAAWSYASGPEVQRVVGDVAVMGRVSEVEMAVAATQALRLERSGQRAAASALMQHSLTAAAPYMPAPAAAAYGKVAEQMEEGMDEETRKRTQFNAYKKRNSR